MKIFNESRLQFSFDENKWNPIISYDTHPDYKKIEKLNGTKGVDFLGICDNKLYLIEVKNFAGFAERNQKRLENSGDILMNEIGQKTKDTFACIVGGKRNSEKDKKLWSEVLNLINDEGKEIVVILWLETNIPKTKKGKTQKKNIEKLSKITYQNYRNKLQTKLKWLVDKKSSVKVLNNINYNNNLQFVVKKL